MQNISRINQSKKLPYSYLFAIALIVLAGFSVALLGVKGLIFSILAISALVLTPYLYNKPEIFLFFSLFIYPLTRFFALEEKFIITGSMYILSLPCALWVMSKYFGSVSKKSFYLWAMMLYIGIILLNVLRPGTAIIELAKEFGRTYYAVFIILSIYNYVQHKPENLRKLSLYFSYIINFIAVVALIQYITRIGGWQVGGFYRIKGTFYGFNEYAYVISLFICFALYFLINSETFRQRLYWTASVGLNLVVLMGTFSKTSMINTGIIFLIMTMFLPAKRRLQIFSGIVISGILLTGFLIATGSINSLILRFMDTKSLEWRFEMWRTLYNMILQGNVWLGQGFNASRNFLDLVISRGDSNAPHNIYLETTYNFGIIGIIPFILIFIFILFQGISIFRDKNVTNNQNKIIGVSVIVISLITMIQNFVSNAFYDRAANIIFWVILTLFVCWYNYYKSINKNEAMKETDKPVFN